MATDIGPRIGIDGEKAFRDSINAVNAQLKSLDAQMQSVTAEFAKNADSEEALTAKNQVLGKSVEAAKQKLSLLDKQLTSQKGKLVALGEALEKAAKEHGENSTEALKAQNAYNQQYKAVANLDRQYNQTSATISQMTNVMEGVTDEAGKATAALGAGDILAASAAWDGIKMAVGGVTDAIRECITTGMEFDTSVANIAATMGTTVDQVGELRAFAQELGATTAFTASEAAEALNYMALAGYSADEAMSALPNVLNLAAAGSIDLASASDMVTDAQSALGLSMEESARMVDEMAVASTKSNTSVAQLGEAILTVGGTAKYMAGSTAEISKVLGVLADSSIKGAEGGTKLRNVILSLTTPTKDAAKTLENLGVSVFNAEGNLREFSEIFPELNTALSRLTDQQQLDALSKIFNSRDIAAAQALLGTSVERWNELDVAIQGAAGSAEKMAQTKLDNLAGDLTLLESAADRAKIAFSDALEPAMRGATKAATAVVTAIGDIIEQNPILGQAMAGVTAALGAAAAAYTIYTVQAKLATLGTKSFTAALTASPIGPIALAVGVVTTAIAAFASEASDAVDANDRLMQSIEESNHAYDESVSALEEEHNNIMGLISTIEQLSETENKTASQKATLLEAIDSLNEAMPELNLAYDEQTDSINMTTEALRELALAEHERAVNAGVIDELTKKYVEQADVQRAQKEASDALAVAQEQYAAALKAYNEEEKEGNDVKEETRKALADSVDAILEADSTYKGLTDTLNGVNQRIADLEATYNENIAVSEEMADAISETGEAAEEATDQFSELEDRAKELQDASLDLANANKTLKSALDEQAESGSLSLDTAMKLIDAGYAAALAIDEETGAVTVDKAAYIALASAKLDEQIASLETQRQSLITAANLRAEQAAAANAGAAYWELAAAKTAAGNTDDTKALEAQIAALKSAKSNLGSYAAASAGAARSGGSASKKIKTQAEKDLETYKSLVKELDHQRNMDEISEIEYYQKLTKLRDTYLTSEDNIDEYRKVNEKIYKIRTEYYEKASELEKKYQKELEDSVQDIMKTYGLFDEVPERQAVAGEELIHNLRSQVESIRGFYENLDALEARGVDKGIVEEIRAMGPDASDQLSALLRLTDKQLSLYSDLYKEKQEAANDAAVSALKDLREETDAQIMENLESIQALYDENAPNIGASLAENLADGITQNTREVVMAATSMAQAAVDAAQAVMSRSGITGLSTSIVTPKSVTINRDVEANMTRSNDPVTKQDMGNMMSALVNGLSTASVNNTPQSFTAKLFLDTGLEVARAFVPNIRTAEKESPEVKNDK